MLTRITAALIFTSLVACQPAERPPAVEHPASKPASEPKSSTTVAVATPAPAEEGSADLFTANDADGLALEESDGSSSLRSKIPLTKMLPDMVLVELTARVAGQTFPHCTFLAKVLKEAASKDKHLRLLGRGKTYRFVPLLSMIDGQPNLSDPATRINLGACYYAPGTKLVIRVGGVDRAAKHFTATAIQLK